MASEKLENLFIARKLPLDSLIEPLKERVSALNKENLDEFRKRVYDEVRDIHVTRFPYNNFLYPEHLDQY